MKRNLKKNIIAIVAMLYTAIVYAYDFKADGIYYNVVSLTDLTVAVTHGDEKYVGDISIPEEVVYNNKTLKVVSIGETAFWRCESLVSVDIPNSVTSIERGAFGYCESLVSVDIPNSVTSIEEGSFCWCTSLVTVTIPNSVHYIANSGYVHFGNESGEYGVFEGCISLISIAIPDSVTSIGDSAFYGCSSLASIAIPDSVTSIGGNAFYGCSSLASIAIPDSVTSIGGGAFEGCSSLASIAIPDSVTSIGESAFSGCKSLEAITLSNSLKCINYGLFGGCSSLSCLEIPGSVAYLSQCYYYFDNRKSCNTFRNCSELKCLKIKYSFSQLQVGYHEIEYDVSYYLDIVFHSSNWSDWTETINDLYIDRKLERDIPVPNLEKLEVGEHIAEIQVENMSKLNNLTTIVCHALVPPTLPEMSNSQYMNLPVSVPEEALAAYQADPVWGKFWNLQAMSVDSLHCSSEKIEIGRYDLSGTSVDANYKGLVIVRFSDGSTKKIIQ